MQKRKILILIVIGFMLEILFAKSVIYATVVELPSEKVTQISRDIIWEGTDDPTNYKAIYRLYEYNTDFLINNIEDLIDISQEVSEGRTTYKDKIIGLARDLDFEQDSSYEDPTTKKYGDLNQDGNVQTIKEELTNKQSGAGFPQIGINKVRTFSGKFYGGNHEIRNLYINQMTNLNAGLFGYADGAEIYDLTVTGNINSTNPHSQIDSQDDSNAIGSIVGRMKSSKVYNCHSKVNINVKDTYYSHIGGIVGLGYYGNSIINCSNTGKISFIQENQPKIGIVILGGIIGLSEDKDDSRENIKSCYNSGEIYVNTKDVIGSHMIGGIQGISSSEDVDKCYNVGNIDVSADGNVFTGGIIAYCYKANMAIKNCYNTGNTHIKCSPIENDENNFAGGIIGYGIVSIDRQYKREIINCCNTGDIINNSSNESQMHIGGLIGSASNTSVTNCYSIGDINLEPEIGSYGGLLGLYANSNVNNIFDNCYYVNSTRFNIANYSTGVETDIFRTEYEKLCSTLNDNINGKKDLVEWICQDKKSPKPNIEVDQNLIVPKVPVSKVGDVADQTYIGNAKVEFKGLKSAKYLIQQVGVYKLNKDTNKWEELKLNKDYTTKDTGEKIINDVSEGEKIEGKLAWTTNETGVVGINYVYYPSGYLPAKENGISNCKLLITGIDEGLEECDCRYFYKGHLFIPPTINVEGYGACEVNGIADNAFENNLEIKKVCLPDTMIYIGKKAFANCRNLENVYRPYTTHTINALKGINVNKCVADDAFEGIEHDIHIYGPREKYSDIFYSYAKNHNIIYIDSEMQGGILYKLDERAKTSSAIYFCRNSIGESAVTDNVNEWYPINDLNYSNDNDLILTSFYDKEEDQYYDLVSIGEQAFIYGLGFNNVEIPNTVKLIGYRAFEQCLGIITIFIPRETTQIQDTYLEKLDLTIRGYLGSEAEAFAKEHNIRFEEVNVKYRDISGDLKIDEEDIKALKEYIASKDELTPEQKKLADITGDGKLNINDVIKLKRYIKALTDEEVAQEHPDWLE